MKELPARQLRLRNKFLPATVGLLLLLQVFVPYRGWWILLVGLGGAWLISYFWARSLLMGLQLEREVTTDCTEVGDMVEERFVLKNPGWAPALWAELADDSTLPDYRASQVLTLAGKRVSAWTKQYTCPRRGVFNIGPATIKSSDPFGLYDVAIQYRLTHPVMIFPPIVPLPFIDEIMGDRSHEAGARDRSIERTVSAAGVREYLPGDSLRWIHWRTSARRESLFVRLFDTTPGRRYWILVDMEAGVQAGEGTDSTDEHAIVLAASLAEQSLHLGHAVGLGAHGERLAWVPPQHGLSQRWAILDALARLQRGPYSLAHLLQRALTKFRMHVGLILITPATRDADWVEALVPLLQRGAICNVLLLDPESFGGQGNLAELETLLPELGVAHHLVTRDLLGQLRAPGPLTATTAGAY